MCIQLFFFNGTAATEIYTCGHTLSLHDALPISGGGAARVLAPGAACRGAGVRPPAQRAAAALQRAGAGGHARADAAAARGQRGARRRSEEHTSELQSLMRISYAGFCLKKKQNLRALPTPHYTLIILNTHL